MEAYILVRTELRPADSAVAEMRTFKGVVSATAIEGPYDLIVTVKADSLAELMRDVLARIHQQVGVTRTITYPVGLASGSSA